MEGLQANCLASFLQDSMRRSNRSLPDPSLHQIGTRSTLFHRVCAEASLARRAGFGLRSLAQSDIDPNHGPVNINAIVKKLRFGQIKI